MEPEPEPEPEQRATDTLSAQVEIPFVPASQRLDTKHKNTEDSVKDSIVVVGAQRKKRKRVKGEGAATKPKEDVDEFDYSTVPNILDDGSDHEEETVDKKRKRKHREGEHISSSAPWHMLIPARSTYRLW